MEEKFYWLGFSAFSGIGPVKFQKLLAEFKTAQSAWNASDKDLKTILGPVLTNNFLEFRQTFVVEKYADQLEKKTVQFLTLADENYPELLKQISNPPFVLYMKGNTDLLGSSLSHVAKDARNVESNLVNFRSLSESRQSSSIKNQGESKSTFSSFASRQTAFSPTIAIVGTRK